MSLTSPQRRVVSLLLLNEPPYCVMCRALSQLVGSHSLIFAFMLQLSSKLFHTATHLFDFTPKSTSNTVIRDFLFKANKQDQNESVTRSLRGQSQRRITPSGAKKCFHKNISMISVAQFASAGTHHYSAHSHCACVCASVTLRTDASS